MSSLKQRGLASSLSYSATEGLVASVSYFSDPSLQEERDLEEQENTIYSNSPAQPLLLIEEENYTQKPTFTNEDLTTGKVHTIQRSNSLEAGNERVSTESQVTPLPWKELLIVLICFLAECLSANLLYPFIADMVRGFRIASDDTSIGYYAGLLASSFILAQFLSSYPLGWLSDRIGRRPILLGGLLCNIIFIILFGLSGSYGLAMTWRCLNGLTNGNFSVVRVYIKEITDSTNANQAFSFMGLTWGIASVTAPLLGGLLSNPSKDWNIAKVFYDYPYLLPCLASACISLVGFVLGYFLIRETLPGSFQTIAEEDNNNDANYNGMKKLRPSTSAATMSAETFGTQMDNTSSVLMSNQDLEVSVDSSEEVQSNISPTFCQLLNARNVIVLSFIFSCLRLSSTLVAEAFSVWAPAKYADGGMALSNAEVSYCFLSQGIASIVFQLFLFVWLLKRLGVAGMLSVSLAVNGLSLIAGAAVRELIKNDKATGGLIYPASYWVVQIFVFFVRGLTIAASFTTVSILINEAISTHIGAAQGVISAFASLAQGLGPIIGGVTLSLSMGEKRSSFPFDQNITFIYSSLLMFLAAIAVRKVR